jgi:DNA polymerase-3 subunit beta
MKLICVQSDLNANLSLASRAISSRPTHPILANVLLVADEGSQRVSLTAFDLSLGIRTSFAAEVTGGGSFTIPAKLLNDIVSRLPDGAITLEDETEDTVAHLTCSSGSYQVRGMSPDEFPELPEIETGTIIKLPPEALIEGFKGTLFATSSDEAKQVLAGVHLKVLPDCLEFAATDGHRLAVVQTPNEKVEGEEIQEFEVTVPAKALREVERILAMRQSTEPVSLHIEYGHVVFEWADQRLTTRTLEGQFPAYRQLIPPSFERQVTLERKSLLAAVERIAVFSDQKNNILKFSINEENQRVILSVDAKSVGFGEESMSAQISGDSIDIAFNVKYLIDILKTAQSPEIKLQLNGALAPVIFQPLGGVDATFLIMPVQLRA